MMIMTYVSMKELREDFGKVRRGLAKGEKYLLVYRSKVLAEIKPVRR